MEASSGSLPHLGGMLAPPRWAFAVALLAAFVLAYAIAASGSDPGPPSGASPRLPDQPTATVPQRADHLRDVAPLSRLAPVGRVGSPAEVPG